MLRNILGRRRQSKLGIASSVAIKTLSLLTETTENNQKFKN
jgi:hypothetical protein